MYRKEDRVITIRHLKIFVMVCNVGSITGAAEKLYMTQPAVSLAIKELEECYGIKLFDRLTRSIVITSDGERILEYAVNIVSLFNDMEKAMKNPDAIGMLRIGSSLTIGTCFLPQFIQELKTNYPVIKTKVTIENSERIVKFIREGQLDIGLVEGAVDDKVLIATKFMNDELVPICCNSHPFSTAQTVNIDDFLAQPLLLRERGSGTRELFESAVTLLGKHIEPTWESISTTAVIREVERGGGVSVLPKGLVSEYLNTGRICLVPLQTPSLKRALYLIYHKNKFLSESIQAFIDIVIKSSH